ncbi:glycosyl transferase [Streptococcus pneumoniae]|uniref:glycosyltransferase family 4 protein n=1 Tax=Streptococcus pneumoniae TaxID=1313 RepID=UPI0005E61EF6|nr:glycosyltransferase family 4 protein [Streptococcus pneumoniae]MDG8325380.1 glycosyltransferase family 4 protein [Streptococcus pneumoniae]MDG8673618.1 glycosyltransferase family 4 protein [Streptococcus pneumoniae]MDG9066736.1 glycosyltransferase family 4 protein [Streptococcus pneumoniae]MDG9489168.1 glycosyltransferase family 4 protein [Streptococcus pneumoniae]CGG67284.1 glycosyl transferase [Streptococcus pneumoniae]
MKKIGIVRWQMHTAGGGEKVAINLASELSQKYEVHLVSMFSNAEVFFSFNNSFRFINLFSKKLSMSKNFLEAVKKLRTYIIEHDIDIVLGIGVSMNCIGTASTLGMKAKFVSCDHTNSIVDLDTRVKRIQRYVASRFADKIITLTTSDRENYIKKYKLNPLKIDYIYNWMDPLVVDKLFDRNSKKLITVGRFDKQKGYDLLSKVAIQVLLNNPDWEWDIYGSGNDQIKQNLITALDKGGVLSRVHFKGNVKGTENIYPGHAIYVMTSRYEGLPLVLLEAKQYGLPIVSFDCPTGPSEIILDGENGYLIENFDVKQMSQKIIELIRNDELRLRFSRNAMLDTDKFNKKRIIEQWIELIEEMTGE